MAKQFYLLTEEDRRRIVADLFELLRVPKNPRLRPAIQPDRTPAPEVYAAYVPAGGIPARAGTALEPADCFLYQILPHPGTASPAYGLWSVNNQSVPVFNLSPNEIGEYQYIPIMRDKFGQWLAVGNAPAGVPGTGAGGTGTGTVSPGIQSVGLGTASSGTSWVNSLTMSSVAVQGGALLVVNIATFGSTSSIGSLTFNSAPLALVGTTSTLPTSLGTISTWYAVVPTTVTASIVAGISGGLAGQSIMFNAVQVTGLPSAFPDTAVTNSASGELSAPTVSSAGSSTYNNEYVNAAFLLKGPGGSWTWFSPFISGGQDILTTGSGDGGLAVDMTEGYDISSQANTFTASLSMVASNEWVGRITSFASLSSG